MSEPEPTEAAAWLRAAAADLDRRLRAGGVPRAERRAHRRLLARAFDALEVGPVELELVRAVDAAAHPLRARIPRGPRIGVPPLRTGPDPRWVARLVSIEGLARTIAGRTQRILDGIRSPEARRALGAVKPRPDDGLDFTLTQG